MREGDCFVAMLPAMTKKPGNVCTITRQIFELAINNRVTVIF